MNAMTLVRATVLLAVTWTVLALGVGAVGVATLGTAAPTLYVPAPSLHDAVTVRRPGSSLLTESRLLDRTTGSTRGLALPEEEDWALLSVSPWRDSTGNLEAIARWFSRSKDGERSWGLALLRLSEATVVHRIALEVLPTGKPCWVPGQAKEVLFPAGGGQLYLCSLSGGDPANWHTGGTPLVSDDALVADRIRRVRWRCEPPGLGAVCFFDAARSSEPGCRNLVFVALSGQERPRDRLVNSPPKLWWLKMSEQGDEIVAAGCLSRADRSKFGDSEVFERMPNVVAGPRGKLTVVYLERRPGAAHWTLCCRRLELGTLAAPQAPRSVPDSPLVLAAGLAASPLVVSADGGRVYALGRTGELLDRAVPE
jgi:hypothetical protein